jgi:copper chaperone
METTTITIRDMSCAHCVRAVENALRRVSAITDAKVTIGEAIVTTEGPPDLAAIRAAIEDEGYQVG